MPPTHAGTGEQPPCNQSTKKAAGRGFEPRPRLQHKAFVFPIPSRFLPERFGFESVGFSVLRDFLMGRSPHNSTIVGARGGVAVSVVCSGGFLVQL